MSDVNEIAVQAPPSELLYTPPVFEGADFSKPRFIVLVEDPNGHLIKLCVSETEKAAVANLKALAYPGGTFHLVVSRLMNIKPRVEAVAPKVKLDGERARVRAPKAPKAASENGTATRAKRKATK